MFANFRAHYAPEPPSPRLDVRTGKQFKQASLTTLRKNRRPAYAEASPDGEDWVEELEHERSLP